MKSHYSLSNQIGLFYTQGDIVFEPEESGLFTPVQNSLMHINLEYHTSKLLSLQCSYNIKRVAVDHWGKLLLVSDEQNYLYMYSLTTH